MVSPHICVQREQSFTICLRSLVNMFYTVMRLWYGAVVLVVVVPIIFCLFQCVFLFFIRGWLVSTLLL